MSFKAVLISFDIVRCGKTAQRIFISSLVRNLDRLVRLPSGFTLKNGVFSIRPRSMAKLNILRVTSSTLLDWVGAPRSTMPSRSRVTSRFVMSAALRLPQSGITSFLRARSSSCQDFLWGFACFSMYTFISSLTVGVFRRSSKASLSIAAGFLPAE